MDERKTFYDALFTHLGTVSSTQSTSSTGQIVTKGQPAPELLPWTLLSRMYMRPTLSEMLFSEVGTRATHNDFSTTRNSAGTLSATTSTGPVPLSGSMHACEKRTLFEAFFDQQETTSAVPTPQAVMEVTPLNSVILARDDETYTARQLNALYSTDVVSSSFGLLLSENECDEFVEPEEDHISNDANFDSMPSLPTQQTSLGHSSESQDEQQLFEQYMTNITEWQTMADDAIRDREEQRKRIANLEEEVAELKKVIHQSKF